MNNVSFIRREFAEIIKPEALMADRPPSPFGADLKVWRHGDLPMPDWVREHMVDATEPNGTFMLKTSLGPARVHIGHGVVLRKGVAWTRPLAELHAFLRELDDEDKHVGDERAERTARAGGAGPKPAARPAKTAATSSGPVVTAAALIARERFSDLLPSAPSRIAEPNGRRPMIEWLPISEILIDDDYQRSVDARSSERLIRQIAGNWDWRLCSPLMVSRRPDGFYCIDGQHRLLGAALRGDIDQLPTHIGDYGGKAEEAAMFTAVNHLRRSVNGLDLHHAGVVAGDPNVTRVHAIVTTAGLKVGRNTGHQSWVAGEVTFTAAILGIARKHGDELATEVLTTIAQSFEGQVLTAGAALFSALCYLIIRPPEGAPLDKERLFAAVRKYDMRGWNSFLTGCNGSDDRKRVIREALLMAYEETPAEAAAC